jgi:Ca2+-binding EF-hand superfamily protein
MMYRVLLIASLIAPGAAMAQTAAPRPAARPPAAAAASTPQPVPRHTYVATMDDEFRKIDADKNVKLTRREIEDHRRAVVVLETQQRNRSVFARLDRDRNGQLSLQEFAAISAPPRTVNVAPILAEVDLNRDGSVTQVEYRAGKLVRFDRMDTDKDSVISVAELRAGGVIK